MILSMYGDGVQLCEAVSDRPWTISGVLRVGPLPLYHFVGTQGQGHPLPLGDLIFIQVHLPPLNTRKHEVHEAHSFSPRSP